jgi:(p)ppGpp synthase/HD superfamily hydrolase
MLAGDARMIDRATEFARAAHAGQKRKYQASDVDYVEHPIRVSQRVLAAPWGTPDLAVVALLHDVVEDTTVKLGEIDREFGWHITGLVAWMTNPKHGSLPRGLRKSLDRDRLRCAPLDVRRLKLLDRIDNVRDMAGAPESFRSLYREESRLMLAALAGTDAELEQELRDLLTSPEPTP